MPLEVAKYFHDILVACRLVEEFTRGKSFTDYEHNALLRAGVEREFIAIGEALAQAMKLDPDSVQTVTALRQIVGFRNVLVHGYAMIHHPTVWGIVENDLVILKQQVIDLLLQADTA